MSNFDKIMGFLNNNRSNHVLIGISSNEISTCIDMKNGYEFEINDDDSECIDVIIEGKHEEFLTLTDINIWNVVEDKDNMVTFYDDTDFEIINNGMSIGFKINSK